MIVNCLIFLTLSPFVFVRTSTCCVDFQITVGSSYTVQYGLTVRQSTLAKILATGSEQDMRAEKTKREKPTQKQQPNKQPATTRKPSQKRRKEQESSKENAKPSKVRVYFDFFIYFVQFNVPFKIISLIETIQS